MTHERWGKSVETRDPKAAAYKYRLSSIEVGGVVRSRLCGFDFGQGMIEHAPISGTVLVAILVECSTKKIMKSYASRDFRDAIDVLAAFCDD